MTTPRVGMRMPSRMPGVSVLRLPSEAVSAQELAKGADQLLGIELEIGAPLGDPAVSIHQDHEIAVHDALAGYGVQTERAHHAVHVVGRTGQEVPGGEIDPVAR